MKVKTDLRAGTGLGDMVADVTHQTGLDKLAVMYEQTTGKSCGCDKRQALLNTWVPELPFSRKPA